MKRITRCLHLILVLFGFFLMTNTLNVAAQPAKTQSVKSMLITGELALLDQGYIIRGTSPAEIFTVLNPVPEVLEKYINKNKQVEISVKIVSGDNVEILTIDGKDYTK